MKRAFVSLLFITFLLSANAVENYIPQYSNPLLESWRWHQIGQFNTSEFAEISQDSSGTIWAAFNNTSALLQSYDGYTWQSNLCDTKNPVGQVNELRILGDSILIGGTNGLMSFKNGSYSYLIQPDENLDYRLTILAVVPVWDSCLVITTNNGLIFVNGNGKYFYTIAEKVDSFNVKLPGYKVITLPQSTYSNMSKSYFINTVVERSNNELWMFAQLNGLKSLLVQRTGKKEEPLEFKIISDFKGKPSFGLDTEVLLGNDDLWLVSKSNFRVASRFDGQKWQLLDLQSLYGESNIHHSIVRMDNGHILIGGDKVIYDYFNENYTHYKYPEVPLGKASKVKLFKTNDDNLLVGLHNKIYLVEYNSKKWISLLNLLYQCEGDVSQEAGGQRTKWYISKQNKVISYKNGEWQSFNVKDGVIDAPVAVSISSDGTVWCVGSHNSGAAFCVFNNGRWHKTLLDTIAASFSKKGVFEDENGDVWIASSDLNRRKKKQGVLKVSNQSGTLEFEYYASPKNVYAGFAIPPNEELIAFTYHYKYAFDKTNNNWERMTISGGSVLSTAQSPDGNLWMATKSDGLYLWNTTGVEKFKVPEYLNIKRFLSIHHNSSALWLVSDDGFYAYAQKQWLSNVFPSDILMLSEKCDINSDKHGKIWMNVYPEQWYHRVFYKDDYNKQSPFLTIGYQSDTFAPRMIEIEYNSEVDHRGNTYIRWKGADYNKWTSDDKLLYSYKLGDKLWTDFSYNTVQTFTALPHGNYSLQVRCMDTDFNISHEPIVAKFKVYPPVYKQPWFIVLISTLTAIILFLIYRAMHRNRILSVLNNNLRYANQQLQEKQEEILIQQEEVYQSKLRFFTNISHEFRTPLTLILGPVKQLKKKFDKAMIEKMLPVIERNSDILLNLVNEIMDFRKLDAGHMKLGARETNMHAFCSEIVNSFNELAKQKQIDYQVSINASEELLWVDTGKMRKVISNLLSNAFKFTAVGGAIKVHISNIGLQGNPRLKNRLEILGRESQLQKFFEISIEDNGIGISQESITSIFTRFYQAEESNEHLGTGIGLALTKELVTLHCGDLLVQSARSVGTRFTVRLPYGTSHLRKEQIIKSMDNDEPEIPVQTMKTQESIRKENVKENTAAHKQLLLIVDDNADIRDYLGDNFKEHYHIIMAGDGNEGLNMAQDKIPDLVISDVMMPVMNGIEFCKKMKTDIKTSHIPVVLLTARSSKKHQLEGLETGADIYVSKPFDIELLIVQVKNLLENRKRLASKAAEHYTGVITANIEHNSIDQKFIEAINKAVQENLSDPDFSLDSLGTDLGMSQRHVQRKLKSISGCTPGELLRNARLTHARQLLEKTDLTVAEVAYNSGFNYPTTFHRLFKEKYNCSPTEYSSQFNSE